MKKVLKKVLRSIFYIVVMSVLAFLPDFWLWHIGVGYQHYKDKSFVYGKPRDVSMNKLAYNLSAGGEYRLSPLVGISAKLNWIVTSSESYSVRYHGQKWQVESPELSGGGGCFSQLSLLFGMNLHF